MGFSSDWRTQFLFALVLVCSSFLPASGEITAHNQCGFGITVYAQNSAGRRQYDVPSGARVSLALGNPWVGGVVWGSQTGNINNGQATQLEFNINPPNVAGRDFYDISLVNAYNLPAMINPTTLAGGDQRNGLECGTPQCTIADINSVCQPDNYFAGPDNACINADGPGTENTPNIERFRQACPEVYVQSNDNANVVYACNTGSDYDAIWCP